MKITKFVSIKNKIILHIAIILISMGGLSYFIIIPTVSNIKKIETEIQAQRIDLENKYQKGQSLKKLNEHLKKIEPVLGNLDQIFINKSRALEFVTIMEGMANKNHVEQKISLLTEKSTIAGDYSKTPLSMIISGNFQDVLNYLSDLEGSSYYININSINIARQNSDTGSVTMQVLANTFWK